MQCADLERIPLTLVGLWAGATMHLCNTLTNRAHDPALPFCDLMCSIRVKFTQGQGAFRSSKMKSLQI